MNNPRVEAAYDRIMRIATGSLTDQKITLYASCDEKFAPRLPPLTNKERATVLGQIKAPLAANPHATDRVLCALAVRSWAREAVAKAVPQIRDDLERDYWEGDPETPHPKPEPESEFTEGLLAKFARRLHLR
jgi:hypothetical protein